MAVPISIMPAPRSRVNTIEMKTRRLVDESPDDRPWDKHGAESQDVMQLFSMGDAWQEKKSESMEWCGRFLTFSVSESKVHKLRKAWFCRARLCPRCQWRRSLAWKARFYQAWPEIERVAPKARYFHLVLTVPNVPVAELRETLGKMAKAWKRMVSRKTWPGIGFVRATEVTIEQNRDGYVHPHFHVLMMVPPSYFKNYYMSAETWKKYWAKGLGVDPETLIRPYMRSIDPKLGKEGVAKAVKELFKYAVKFDQKKKKENDGAWRETYLELDRQLKGLQATSLGGIFREVFRGSDEVSDDEMIGASESSDDAVEFRQYVYDFSKRFYVFHKTLCEEEVANLKSGEVEIEERRKAMASPLPEPVRSNESERIDWEINRACLKAIANDSVQLETKKVREKKREKLREVSPELRQSRKVTAQSDPVTAQADGRHLADSSGRQLWQTVEESVCQNPETG